MYNPDDNPLPGEGELFDRPSRGKLKREAQGRQDLGKRLCELNDKQLAQFSLDEHLLEAIRLYKRLTKNEALRRQLQYIGRLMGGADIDAIRKGIEEINHSRRADATQFQECEDWRDRILADDDVAIQEFVTRFPDADRQHLRQLSRNAKRESDAGKPPASARLLFAYVRQYLMPK